MSDKRDKWEGDASIVAVHERQVRTENKTKDKQENKKKKNVHRPGMGPETEEDKWHEGVEREPQSHLCAKVGNVSSVIDCKKW